MNVLRRIVGLVAFAVVPVVGLSGCDTVAGDPQGLAPEDEPHLFDLSDPSFELATPCKDITDEQLQELGLRQMEEDEDPEVKSGLEMCSFFTQHDDSVVVTSAALKLPRLREDAVAIPYDVTSEKQPAFVFSENGSIGCTVAAETNQGTVLVEFSSNDFDMKTPEQDCPDAEKYFDILIGGKLNEYRSHRS